MKSSFASEGPAFNWVGVQQDQRPEETTDIIDNTANNIVTTIKDIVNTFVNNQTETITFATINTTEITPNETLDSNKSMVETGQTVFNEMFSSNATVQELNNTLVTEMFENNATTAATMVDTSNTTNFNVLSDSVTSVVDTVVTTSESFFSTVSEVIIPTTISDISTEEGMTTNHEHYDYDIEDKTLYIVLGVILAALVSIIIILLIVYRRYKNQNRTRSGAYCVTDLNEVSVLSNKEPHCDQRINHFN